MTQVPESRPLSSAGNRNGRGGVVPWIAFISCVPFTYFAISEPLLYYFIDADGPHRGDYAIGWFWMTICGIGPALILAALAFMRRDQTPWPIRLLWLGAYAPVIVSGIMMLVLA